MRKAVRPDSFVRICGKTGIKANPCFPVAKVSMLAFRAAQHCGHDCSELSINDTEGPLVVRRSRRSLTDMSRLWLREMSMRSDSLGQLRAWSCKAHLQLEVSGVQILMLSLLLGPAIYGDVC